MIYSCYDSGMTAVVGAPKLYETDAGVVHALMQARYQKSSRGQFISEDPVFLGDPRQQVSRRPAKLLGAWRTYTGLDLSAVMLI
jgi:hypothetical protein